MQARGSFDLPSSCSWILDYMAWQNQMTTAMVHGCSCPMKNAAVPSSCFALQDLPSCCRLARLFGRRQLGENSWILNKNKGHIRDPAGYHIHTGVQPIPRTGQVLETCEKLKNSIQELEAFRLLGTAVPQ